MKKVISVVLSLCLLSGSLSALAAPAYSDNVAPFLAELKIMQGDPDGNLRLDDFVSRAECAKIAVAASSYRDTVASGSKTAPFKDVPASHWAAPYITVGVRHGLLRGYLDASFKPSDTVLYEEALTMFLRILGYSEEDFGPSWPDGQVGIAKNIGLCDGLKRTIGDTLSRRDMMIISYNLLNTPAKNANSDYLSTFNRAITDDVMLIASHNENASIDTGKILTSAGTYNVTETFDLSNVGKSGSITLRNNDTVVSFIPDAASVNTALNRQVVYAVMDDSSIMGYNNGTFHKLEFTAETAFYDDNAKSSYTSILQKISMGDILNVRYDENGKVDYVVYAEGSMNGPVTVKNDTWYSAFGIDASDTTIMRDGVKVALSEIQTNDITYYSKDLNMILAYSKKVTGIYESATPNKDTPSSVTVSGVTYSIEGVDAFAKLSSNGSFEYGDTVTLLLGKSGEVADVLTQSQLSNTVTGYLIETGTKETTVNASIVTKPFVRLILPSGEAAEYITTKDYQSLLNRIVKVSLKDGNASASLVSQQSDVYGLFTWEGSTRTLGSKKLSTDLKIIEVSTTSASEAGKTQTVFAQRLNGLKLSSSSILYAAKNKNGEITELILTDTTGDMHAYGVVTSAKKNTTGMSASGTYTYLLNGTEKTFSSNGTSYNVSNGQPVQIATAQNGAIIKMTPLTKVSGSKVSDITGDTVTYNGKAYKLSDKVCIYAKDSSYNYSMLSLDELKSRYENYSISLYCDKAESLGGRIRVIIAIAK